MPAVEHVPRVLPKDEDPSLVNRNRRMLGQLLGTLEVCKVATSFFGFLGGRQGNLF